jgi:hypothetical protein
MPCVGSSASQFFSTLLPILRLVVRKEQVFCDEGPGGAWLFISDVRFGECLVVIAAADIFFKLCRTSALRSQCHGPISMLKEMWNLRLFFSSHPLPHMTYLRTTILTRQSSSYMFDVCSSLMNLMNFFQNISVFLRFGLATFVTVLFLL